MSTSLDYRVVSDSRNSSEGSIPAGGKKTIGHHCGPDSLPPATFALGGSDMPSLLANTSNLSIRCHNFPSQWETSVMKPGYRNGKRWDSTKFCPINHAHLASRNMERLSKTSLTAHLLEHEPINTGQRGFRPKKSCAASMTDCLNAIHKAMNTGRSVMVIISDVTKAFDRVSP